MNWFGGSIPEAVGLAKSTNAIFVVYICGKEFFFILKIWYFNITFIANRNFLHKSIVICIDMKLHCYEVLFYESYRI